MRVQNWGKSAYIILARSPIFLRSIEIDLLDPSWLSRVKLFWFNMIGFARFGIIGLVCFLDLVLLLIEFHDNLGQ